MLFTEEQGRVVEGINIDSCKDSVSCSLLHNFPQKFTSYLTIV